MATKTLSAPTVSANKGVTSVVWHGLNLLFGVLSLGAMAYFMWMSLIYAKDAQNLAGVEQVAQRIFYIHMGCIFGARQQTRPRFVIVGVRRCDDHVAHLYGLSAAAQWH